MRLLKRLPNDDFTLVFCDNDKAPPYAILSHTWIEGQEVTYQELVSGVGKDKAGYAKLRFCGDRAAADGLEFFWVDTCCIDKSTSEELTTAINSMFRWYQRASKCYVYLSDVSVPDVGTTTTWVGAFQQSRWFTRGWTLQELLAPDSVEFFSQQGSFLGSRASLVQEIHRVTELPVEVLTRQKDVTGFSVEERFSWAARRTTTLKEDRVYCLLGIFGVFLPLIYGEGEEHAAKRLKEEIRKEQGLQTTNTYNNMVLGTTTLQQTPGRDVMDFESFLRSLSYPEMNYRFHDIEDVRDDTCSWLLDHPHYQEWQEGAGSKHLLMIRGKPGSGKSTAMKKAYELARDRSSRDEAILAFFFNSRGASMETKLEGFYLSTLHQLLRSHGSANDDTFKEWQEKKKIVRSGWAWTVKELQRMFKQYVVRSTISITIFMDALDECESASAARTLMDVLTNLNHVDDSGQPRLKFCVSSRHYPNVGVAEPLQIIVEKNNEVDIAQYIETTLQSFRKDLGDDIPREIASRAEGMFLWAYLVLKRIIEAIENGESLTKLYDIIRDTPKRLEEVLQELIDDIPIYEREQSNLLISWILFAKRPLTLAELTHAWAFRTQYSTFLEFESSEDFVRPEQMRRLLAKYTRGLIEAVEIVYLDFEVDVEYVEPKKVQLTTTEKPVPTFRVQCIHESVRQHLLARRHVTSVDMDAKWSNSGFADHVLALSCFNYIKAVCAETHVVDGIVTQMRCQRFEVGQLYQHHTKDRPFLEYAIQSGFDHAKAADVEGYSPLYLFRSTKEAVTASQSWWMSFASIVKLYWKRGWHDMPRDRDIKHWSQYATTQLDFACAYKLDSWLDNLLSCNSPGSNSLELSKALCVAAAFGNESSVLSLINAGADVNYEDPTFGSPLNLSLIQGQNNIVKALIKHQAATRKRRRKHSPLITAVSHSPLGIVLALLEHGASVTEWEYQDTPAPGTIMHALKAAVGRDPEFLEALLPYAECQGVHVEYYKTAFLFARRGSQPAARLKSTVAKLFPGHSTITITINILDLKRMEIEAWQDTLVSDLKEMLGRNGAGPFPDRIMLMCRSRVLRDRQTLCECQVQQGSTIDLLYQARWGGSEGTNGG